MKRDDRTARTPTREGLARVRMLVLDVDGVLTDGRISFVGATCEDPQEIKSFHVRDGLAVKWAGRMGIVTAIITARRSSGVERRAREMEVRHLTMGAEAKLSALYRLSEQEGIPLQDIAYVGDDLPDLGPMAAVGLPIAVADAAAEVKAAAAYVTERVGGDGAVREIVELLLEAQGKWRDVVEGNRGEP